LGVVRHAKALCGKRNRVRAVAAATVALGERAYQVGLGDSLIRRQIASLDEQIRLANAGKEPTTVQQQQRERLLVQIANQVLALKPLPVELVEQAKQVEKARAELGRHLGSLREARAIVAPKDGATRRRLVIGYGTAMACLMLLILFFALRGGPPTESVIASTRVNLVPGKSGSEPGQGVDTKGELKGQLFEGKTIAAWVALMSNPDGKGRKDAPGVLRRIGQPAVEFLITAINSKDPTTCEQAAYVLGEMGEVAKPAVPVLLELAKGKNLTIRTKAATALFRISPEHQKVAIATLLAVMGMRSEQGAPDEYAPLFAEWSLVSFGKPAVPLLIKALKDPQVRGYAASILGEIGPSAKEAVQALTVAMKDETVWVRIAAAGALARINPDDAQPGLDLLLKILDDPSDSTSANAARESAASALGKIGPAARCAVPSLTRLSQFGDEAVRSLAVQALKEIGTGAAETKEPVYEGKPLSVWVKALKEGDAKSREDAAFALMKMGPAAREAMPALSAALTDPNLEVVKFAAITLGKIGGEGVPPLILGLQDEDETLQAIASLGLREAGAAAVPSLIRLLRSSNRTTASYASSTLGKIGEPAVNDLVVALDHHDTQVRGLALLALGAMGDVAKVAVPAIRKRLNDDHPGVRKAAADILSKIGRDTSAQVLPSKPPSSEPTYKEKPLTEWVKGLEDRESNIRIGAANALAEMGMKAKPAVAVLIKTLGDREKRVRMAAASALGAIGPEASEAVPTLIAMLKTCDGDEVFDICYGLRGIGKPAVVPLIGLLDEPNFFVRWHAAKTLGNIGPEAADAVARLTEALKDRHSVVRSYAATALGKIGPRAKGALDALADSLRDQEQSVREAAADAIRSIDPTAKVALPLAKATFIQKFSKDLVGRMSRQEFLKGNPSAKEEKTQSKPRIGYREYTTDYGEYGFLDEKLISKSTNIFRTEASYRKDVDHLIAELGEPEKDVATPEDKRRGVRLHYVWRLKERGLLVTCLVHTGLFADALVVQIGCGSVQALDELELRRQRR